MKKLILILFFTLLTATSFAQASAASARMFKNSKAWKQREYLRNSRGYTLDTAELYAIIRLSKDFEGHVNWQYSTINIANTFSSLFPILGRTTPAPMVVSYYNFQTSVRYSGHEIQLIGSPTLSNNSITFNGTTQYGRLRYYREWAGTFANMTPRLLMDTLLNVSATDTAAQTRMNLSIYMKDSTDNIRFGANNSTGTPQKNFRIIKVGNIFQSVIYDNVATSILNYTLTGLSTAGLFTTARNGLVHKSFINGIEVASATNASYNFSFARESTNQFEVMASSGGANLAAGTIQFLAIMNRAYTSDEQLAYYNAVKEFVRRKTQ